jgi:hypothetical protein
MRDRVNEPAQPAGPPRWRLFLPFGMVVVVGIGLSAFWFQASRTTRAEIDAWLKREASVGRNWSCGDQSIGGFPFRIEFTCDRPSFEGEAEGRRVSGKLTSALAVAQVYTPNLVIVEAQGPLEVSLDDGSTLDARWKTMRASLRGTPGRGLERFSIEGQELDAAYRGPLLTTSVKAADAQLHLRPTPNAAAPGSYDVALSATGASAPGTAMLFGADTVDLEALATVTEAQPLSGRGLGVELQRWHEAGGEVRLTRFMLGRPDRLVQAQGTLRLDDDRRPEGSFDISITGLDRALALLGLGGKANLGSVLGSLLGKPKGADDPAGAGPKPKPVTMTLRLDKGRAMLGPLPLGSLTPLY